LNSPGLELEPFGTYEGGWCRFVREPLVWLTTPGSVVKAALAANGPAEPDPVIE